MYFSHVFKRILSDFLYLQPKGVCSSWKKIYDSNHTDSYFILVSTKLWKIQTVITYHTNNIFCLWNLIFSMGNFITLLKKITILNFFPFCEWNYGVWGKAEYYLLRNSVVSLSISGLGRTRDLGGPGINGGGLWFIQNLKSQRKLLSEGKGIKGSN